MTQGWTFGQRVAASFAVTTILALTICIVAFYALQTVVTSKDRVIDVDAQLLIDAETLHARQESMGSELRAFLLTGDERFMISMAADRDQFEQALARIRQNAYTEEGRLLAQAIERAEQGYQQAAAQVAALRRTDAPLEAVVRAFDEQVSPRRDQLERELQTFVTRERLVLAEAKQEATDVASTATLLMTAIGAAVVLFAIIIAVVLTRLLTRQIAEAVGQVQSSSTELQAAANQQATGAKEQATAMSEITTTISELLATSRQISESAQRVSHIAEDMAKAAWTGEGVVEKAQESISAIRQQVDLVVSHMLDLGNKSQQIGVVLEIVSELAEQTNILAINATIEAAGAGEAGSRFAVVADEIRKLADRVADSTKEIRGLIEDVRSAVNTTVMATESGSKAVDSGSRQFSDVATTFKQIAAQVGTTAEAAREIELSTQQQTTAVEQVNLAIANVAQASRESEASTGQTLQTASQLARLSQALVRLIRPQTATGA